MKTLVVVAALVLASTAAQAQYTFEYGGRTIRVDPDRGTVSIPGVYDNTGRHSKRARSEERSRKHKSQQAKTDTPSTPASAPPTSDQATAPTTAAPAAATEPSTTTAAASPADTAARPAPAPPASAAPPASRPALAAAPASTPKPPAAAQANSPVGVWLTEESEGKVRIEQCGANLCGYAVDKGSDQNAEQVLINMKPGKDKWSGRILDPNTGSTYESTIALQGSDTLRVQGCAFGGVFCGGQTWTRVN
jgi:uncharacterized protein (DUF2147 family)